ncbi:carbamoyltransferase [Pendulispora albinea]|uniref:Carbamoyltransferase n=1 Tax=Pendulispora albinea TaxID=2741071 RepID=A0ABZ2MB37_9BACT
MKRNYIGLASTLHDSALAIVNAEGTVVFAEATERYLQNKRSINCAPDFIDRTLNVVDKYCDRDAELVIAHSWSADTTSEMTSSLEALKQEEAKLLKVMGEVPDFMKVHLASREFVFESQARTVGHAGVTLKYELNLREGRKYAPELVQRRYDHHRTHAAAAAYTSPFDEAVCAVLDGYGEGSSTGVYRFRNGRLDTIEGISDQSSASLGFLYTMLCVACGFGPLTGEEWKVMGLAPYGEINREHYELLRSFIQVDGVRLTAPPDAVLLKLSQKIHEIRRKKHESPWAAAHLARAGQQVFCDIYFEFLNNLHALGISDNLVLGGGCALNSAANGQILKYTPFKNVHIFSAPGDDGNALGAAMLAYREDHPNASYAPKVQSPYLGTAMSDDALAKLQKFGPSKQERLPFPELCKRAAQAIADGKFVGWVQGRAEFGPRALGNRSILADARSPDMKDRINARVKFREEFRPFAPAILHEHGPEYFHDYQDTPYMERTLEFKDSVLSKVPGVVHKDNTGRLQTVKKEYNEKFYRLVHAFYDITGVPLVCNTSFNVMGKPIIHTVEDALAVFYTSGLDVLVIEDLFIQKA